MALVVNGDGNITGLTAGGLPDASITQSELASGVVGNGPAFEVRLTSNQTSQGSGGNLKLQFNNVVYDTNSCFVPASYRFLPNVAGYYMMNCVINYVGAEVTETFMSLYKNGSQHSRGMNYGTNSFGSTYNGLVYLNGSTDYVEMYHYFVYGSNKDINSLYTVTYWNGYLARAA